MWFLVLAYLVALPPTQAASPGSADVVSSSHGRSRIQAIEAKLAELRLPGKAGVSTVSLCESWSLDRAAETLTVRGVSRSQGGRSVPRSFSWARPADPGLDPAFRPVAVLHYRDRYGLVSGYDEETGEASILAVLLDHRGDVRFDSVKTLYRGTALGLGTCMDTHPAQDVVMILDPLEERLLSFNVRLRAFGTIAGADRVPDLGRARFLESGVCSTGDRRLDFPCVSIRAEPLWFGCWSPAAGSGNPYGADSNFCWRLMDPNGDGIYERVTHFNVELGELGCLPEGY